MSFPRVRIRTLMVAVAIAAILCAIPFVCWELYRKGIQAELQAQAGPGTVVLLTDAEFAIVPPPAGWLLLLAAIAMSIGTAIWVVRVRRRRSRSERDVNGRAKGVTPD
jgi:hypothetical protein